MLPLTAAVLVTLASTLEPAAPAPSPAPAPQTPSQPAPAAPAPKQGDTPAGEQKPGSEADSAYVLGFTVNDIDGNPVDLSQYKGKVVLIVNVASKCGYTPQYAGLEKLYKAKADKGFVILGFPANDFGEQEPGTNSEIKSFCTSKYNVTFPMFAKISVRGTEQHPLYKKLASQPKPIGGDPGWNFTKFLVDKQGNVVARFDSKTKPEDASLNKKIDEQLAK